MSPSKPDVVIVTNVYFPTLGGITTYVQVLSKELIRRGHDVFICAIPDAITRREERIRSRMARRLVHELTVLVFTLSTILRILVLKLKGRKVVVHSQSASFCLGVAVMAKPLGVRAIHTFHSPIGGCTPRLKAFLPFVDAVVCVSEEHRQEYSSKCGIPEYTPLIPGGIDTDLFAPFEDGSKKNLREEVLKPLGIPDTNGPIVLFISRIIKEKGVIVLLDASKKIQEKLGTVMFILVGPLDQTLAQSHQMKEIKDKIQSSVNVHVTGNMPYERLSSLYKISDILALPSLIAEGSPMVVVEAMASGLPVVATRAGGLGSRVADNVTGRLISQGDVNELANTIVALLKDPERMKTMGRKAREIALERYSVGAMVDAYEEIYAWPILK